MQLYKQHMLDFKGWDNKILSEGAFKEGAVMEGVFAIAVALYLRDNEMPSIRELDKYRRKIIPKKMTTEPWTAHFGPKWDQVGKKPKDIFDVYLIVRLKEGEMVKGNVSAFGDNDGEKYYAKAGDIEGLSKKMATMLRDLRGTHALKKIDKFIDDLLENNTKDQVKLYVDADGVTGESSGGLIKSDVTFKIIAKTGGKRPKVLTDEIAFSLKSDSKTFAGPGAWEAVSGLAKAFNYTFSPSELPERLQNILMGNATNAKMMSQKRLETAKMFDLLIDKMIASPPNAKNIAFQLLKQGAFGTDLADIIDFKKNEIKELSPETIEKLHQHPAYKGYDYKFEYVKAVEKGKVKAGKDVGKISMMVTHPNGTEKFWHLRAKLLMNKSSSTGKDQIELKVLFEGAPILFRKTHHPDPNYNMDNFDADWKGTRRRVGDELKNLKKK